MNNLKKLIRLVIALLLLPVTGLIIVSVALVESGILFGYWLFDRSKDHPGYHGYDDTKKFITVFTHWLRFQE